MKLADFYPGRKFYRPSGGVRFWPFSIWMLPAIASAALLAQLLFRLFINGYYYVFMAPLLVALPVGALVRLAVIKGHCRNRLIPTLGGFCAAVVLYLGYFYWGMIYHWGPHYAGRLDLLPRYVQARMKSDVIEDEHRSRESPMQDPGMNWFYFGLDAVVVLLVAVGPGMQRSRRPYCEICGCWMTRHTTSFRPNTAITVSDALRTGSSRALAELCATPVYSSLPYLALAVDLCPSLRTGGSRGCPVYISVKQVNHVQAGDPFNNIVGMMLRTTLASAEEIAALAPRFKLLDGSAGPSIAAEASQATAGQAVETESAGKALGRGMLWADTILAFAPTALFFAGLGLAAWAVPAPDRAVSPRPDVTVLALMAAGLACAVVGAIVALKNPRYIADKVLGKQLRRDLARRPKRLVNPNDPQALFVEIVPKVNWGALTAAGNPGFLLLDEATREILFEGARQSFRLPAHALTDCFLGELASVSRLGRRKIRCYYVVLRIESPKQFWEGPIRVISGVGLFGGDRERETTRLLNRIGQMRSTRRAGTNA